MEAFKSALTNYFNLSYFLFNFIHHFILLSIYLLLLFIYLFLFVLHIHSDGKPL